MSRRSGLDLSGEWAGIYNFPHSLPPVSFEAVLVDQAGRLSGTTQEKAGPPFRSERLLTAVIDGVRNGHAVEFAKMYDQADREYDTVAYRGQATAEGEEIHGNWTVGAWSGTFLMVRRPASEESAALEIEAVADR